MSNQLYGGDLSRVLEFVPCGDKRLGLVLIARSGDPVCTLDDFQLPNFTVLPGVGRSWEGHAVWSLPERLCLSSASCQAGDR